MYNEEKNERSYFFRNLIVKVLLILLFVFLLMWLLPMPNLNPVLDKIFTQNMSSMTDAAKGYFTTSRLPSKEGESKKLTLKEMLDNKMLIEFTDSNGKACDLNKSYVEVTKKDGEYIFKTNLSCPSQEDYVIEYFGCYDVCADDSCKKDPVTATEEVKEYRFYKVTEEKLIDKYICKNGYTLSGTKCVLKSTTEIKEDATLKCLTGYIYNKETKVCEKELTEKVDAYKSCPIGYIYSAGADKCIKNESNITDAELSYTCESGTLNNDTKKCETTLRREEYATPEYKCSEGVLNSNNKCDVKVTTTIPQTCNYTKWVCSYVETKSTMNPSSTPTSKVTLLYPLANGGYKYEVCTRKNVCTGGGTSTSTVEKDIATIVSYKCIEGTLRDNKCIVSRVVESEATKKYTCKSGNLDGTLCVSGKVIEADYTYKCSIGTLSGNKCLIYTTDKVEPTYVCKEGYTKAGNSCYKTESSSDIYNAEIVYKTVSKKAYKWSKSETLKGWTRTGETRTATVAVTSK